MSLLATLGRQVHHDCCPGPRCVRSGAHSRLALDYAGVREGLRALLSHADPLAEGGVGAGLLLLWRDLRGSFRRNRGAAAVWMGRHPHLPLRNLPRGAHC